MDGSPILQLVFTSGTLTVRGEHRVSVGDGVSQHGRPYEFTDAEGILVDRHALVSVTLLSDADLQALDLGGLPLLAAGDQNWRATIAAREPRKPAREYRFPGDAMSGPHNEPQF